MKLEWHLIEPCKDGRKRALSSPGALTHRGSSSSQEQGFTLIELLVVVAIIGILTAISIPQYSRYKQVAFDAQAESDLRNGAVSQEATYTLQEEYVSCANEDCECDAGVSAEECSQSERMIGFRISPSVRIEFESFNDVIEPYYTAEAWSTKGTGRRFTLDSREGRITTVQASPER